MLDDALTELKSTLHGKLINEIDLEWLNRLDESTARERVGDLIRDMLIRDKTRLALYEREQITRDILDELFGLGPIRPLLTDTTVSDILVNGARTVFVERHGTLERTELKFSDDQHLMRIIERIVSRVGRRVDESSPMVDARLADGSRVNVIIPPLAIDGPQLSIRRFGHSTITEHDLVAKQTLTVEMLELLRGAVKARLDRKSDV